MFLEDRIVRAFEPEGLDRDIRRGPENQFGITITILSDCKPLRINDNQKKQWLVQLTENGR